MGMVTVSGETGCKPEETARLLAQRRGAEWITCAHLDAVIQEQYREQAASLPARAWPALAGSILARLALDQHLVIAAPGAELLFRNVSGILRARLVGSEPRRIGMLMLDRRLDRPGAKSALKDAEREERAVRQARFGRVTLAPSLYDVLINVENFDPEQSAALLDAALTSRGVFDDGRLSASAEAQLQFGFRLQLAKYGIAPPGIPQLKKHSFVHPSEEIFSKLLDFYRIAWEYEPRSFPLQWDKHGNVLEAFTPDFYLPEFDMYVELTTMKQAHVTKKNRKVKLLRSIYPDIKIQVFYQKDFQNLIFKFGLGEKGVQA